MTRNDDWHDCIQGAPLAAPPAALHHHHTLVPSCSPLVRFCGAAPEALEGPFSLAAILAYIIFFALGAGPIPWLYMPEVLPVEILGVAQAFCTCLNWTSNLLVSATFPMLLAALGIAGSYCVYAVLNALAALFLAKRMVETKQQPVERIRALLMGEGN
jgi:hypothetical protein